MALILMVLMAIAMTPVAINLRTPPSRGVSTAARVTIATLDMAVVAAIGLGYGIAAHRLTSRRKKLAITGVVLMAIVGTVIGLIALFSAGF